MFGQTGWVHKNVQPGRDVSLSQMLGRVGICPHYELLKTIAELFGVDIDAEDQFCGQMGATVNNIGFLSGKRGTEYHPRTFCVTLLERLNAVASYLEDSTAFSLDDCLGQIAELFSKDGEDNKKQFKLKVNSLLSAQAMQSSLRTMMENAPLVDDPARPMVEAEMIAYAGRLLESLKTTVIGNRELAVIRVFGRIKCVQAPGRDFDGVVS